MPLLRRLVDLSLSASGANIISFGIAAVFGLAANLIVAAFWQASGLGIFAQTFAFYIFASQISVGGVQNAVLTYISRHPSVTRARGMIFAATLIMLAGSVLVIAVLELGSSWIGEFLNSPSVGAAISTLWLSLLAGSMNKILLAALNGLSRFYAFALLQASRAVFVFVGICVAGLVRAPIEWVPLFFGMGEALAVFLGAYLLRDAIARPRGRHLSTLLRRSFIFGIKSMPSGALAELNSRVDILILGFFVSDAIVGTYAFAALLSEGFFNLVLVARIILGPRTAGLLAARRYDELRQLVRKTALPFTVLAFLALGGLGVFCWVGLSLLPLNLDPNKTTVLFLLVSSGIAAAASLLPYSTVLMLDGRPGAHSLFFLSVLMINLVGGLILTPMFSAPGTAVATAISYVGSACLLYWLVLRILHFRLL